MSRSQRSDDARLADELGAVENVGFMIALLLVQILVVQFFGVEPKKRRLEEIDSGMPASSQAASMRRSLANKSSLRPASINSTYIE